MAEVHELDDRIAILRDNIRQLVEQAAAVSGAGGEERAADRIAQQTDDVPTIDQEALMVPTAATGCTA